MITWSILKVLRFSILISLTNSFMILYHWNIQLAWGVIHTHNSLILLHIMVDLSSMGYMLTVIDTILRIFPLNKKAQIFNHFLHLFNIFIYPKISSFNVMYLILSIGDSMSERISYACWKFFFEQHWQINFLFFRWVFETDMSLGKLCKC